MSTAEIGYEPPLPKGQRVRATAEAELVPEGTLGTITWTHPFPDMPYRVLWDGHEVKPGEVYFGMSDTGWLTAPNEIVPLPLEPHDYRKEAGDGFPATSDPAPSGSPDQTRGEQR